MILVLVNGFFVAAEFAIIGVRATQLEERAVGGDALSARLLGIVQSTDGQDRFIATAQLGITIASLGLGMYGEPKIAGYLEPYLARLLDVDLHTAVVSTIGYLVSLSLLTYLHIVIGEMVPKTISLASPVRVVRAVASPMALIQAIMLPLVNGLNMIGNGLMRLLRVPPVQGHERLHSSEEIEMIVTQSTEEGLLDLGQEEMIRNILDFSERTVGQVMTPRTKIQAIDAEMPYDQVVALVTESNHSRFPVYRGDLDHIIGILHLKDLVRHELASTSPLTWRALLRQAPTVPENFKIEKLLAAFKQSKIHLAVVLDEFGGLAGIVTLEDLVEEIVGEVRDEFDHELEPMVELAPGVLEMDGSYLVEDLQEKLPPHAGLGETDTLPDVETVGGLIITWLGRPPVVGDVVVHNENLRLQVMEVEGLAVSRAKLEFPPLPHLLDEDAQS
jgi:CBS domain containing-hemolysin-like protein